MGDFEKFSFIESAILDLIFQKNFLLHFYENPSKVLGYQGRDKILINTLISSQKSPTPNMSASSVAKVMVQFQQAEKLPLIASKEAKAISLAIDGAAGSGNESSRTLPRWNFVTVTGAFFFVPLARRRAKKNPVLLEGNQSMVLGS